MRRKPNPHLPFARARAYRSTDPLWWTNLGAVYATSKPPDLKRARWWYRRAARRGDLQALFEYGLMLIRGEGGPRRPAQGRRSLESAARGGDVAALKVLSYAYTRGAFSYRPSAAKARRTKRDLGRAMRRLRQAPAG